MLALWINSSCHSNSAAFLLGGYNGLVRLRNQVKNAWAQIDVQFKTAA